jgi:hypothetical protein
MRDLSLNYAEMDSAEKGGKIGVDQRLGIEVLEFLRHPDHNDVEIRDSARILLDLADRVIALLADLSALRMGASCCAPLRLVESHPIPEFEWTGDRWLFRLD